MPGGRPKKPGPQRRRRGTGSVGTRTDGRIFAILPARLDPSRRPIYTVGHRAWRSEAEAAAWLDAEVARPLGPGPPAGADEPLGVYLARWHQAGSRLWPPRTASAYKRSLALLFEPLGHVPVGRLTHVLIREALAGILGSTWTRSRADGTVTFERPYSRRTVEGCRMVLGLALGDLTPEILPQNPVRRVKLPTAQPPEQPVWDADQAERFLEAAERVAPQHALAFRILLRRALRHGELLALRWDDLRERRRILVIDETAGERAGEAGDTKGRRTREIPLSADLVARLRARRSAQQRQCPTPWIFANPDTGRPYGHGALGDAARLVAREAGLPPIAPKDMRATAATNLLLGGMPLPLVSQLLGHASIEVTSTFYARVIRGREAMIARLAEDLDGALERAAETARGSAPTELHRAE